LLNKDPVWPAENMLMLKRFCAVTFPTTTGAIQAEEILKELGTLPFMIMPIPSSISAGCGLSIKTTIECGEELVALLRKEGVPIGGAFEIDKETKTIDRIS